MNSEAKIQELEAKVAELTALVERLVPQDPAVATAAPIEHTGAEAPGAVVGQAPSSAPQEPTRASRRNLLKLAGAAAAGTAAAVAANALPAAAADGDPINIAETTSTTAGTRPSTVVVYSNSATPQVPGIIIGSQVDANMFTVRDTPGGLVLFPASSSSYPAAIGGYSYRTVANGVYGFTSNAGYGVVGSASNAAGTGMLARGLKANLELYSDGTAPTTRTDAHLKGELICDTDGTVWACVAAGSPGTWRKLAGANTAGSFHALTPGRVYDSRQATPAPGALASGTNRTVSVADRRNDTNGAVIEANFVPVGATAVTANVTVTETAGTGFLAVNPGGNTTLGASTINWFGPNQNLANGVTLTLGGNRELTVLCGGGGSAHFIIDITGYYR